MRNERNNPWAVPYKTLTVMVRIAVLGFVLAVIAAPFYLSIPARFFTPAAPVETAVAAPVSHAFDNISLVGKAAFVYDVREHRVLFAKNEEAQLPLASLTKIMTAIVAAGTLPPYTTIPITPESVAVATSSNVVIGEKWRLQDLLDYTLVLSSNDGASSIAAAAGAVMLGHDEYATGTEYQEGKNAFIAKMNATAKSLGLVQTYYLNETGLDESTQISGAYGSARDMATLLTYVLARYPNLFSATRYSALRRAPENGAPRIAINTDIITSSIPDLLISKTGYTDLAGGNLAVVFDASFGHPIIVVVLGSTEPGRFEDVKKLVDAAINSFNENLP